ncbi:MAG: hypothetical protein HOD92_13580 [Deltaproteobacteria bacterium]|jgi:hypothetical protein|nr:hypothetical protein [Deltaproteobacteria bacterium]MBT4527621.1 hypothetical protein [Deltaproteobacteria bacterium]
MKSFKNIFVSVLLILGLVSGSIAFAQGWGNKGSRGGKRWQQNQSQRAYGPGFLLRQEMFQARLDVLAELAGSSADEMSSKLGYKPMWAVLDEYKVDFKIFQTKMHEKAIEVVNKAAENGKITAEQKDLMLNQMENGPQQNAMRGKGFRRSGRGMGSCRMN